MNLNNFENYIYEVIAERGREYFHHGHVETIKETDEKYSVLKKMS